MPSKPGILGRDITQAKHPTYSFLMHDSVRFLSLNGCYVFIFVCKYDIAVSRTYVVSSLMVLVASPYHWWRKDINIGTADHRKIK